MKKVNKITVILTAVLVIAIIATIAEIISSVRDAKAIDWLPLSAIYSTLAVAFSSISKKSSVEA